MRDALVLNTALWLAILIAVGRASGWIEPWHLSLPSQCCFVQ